jgi:ADP-heptose:LPS heptosyltransferase
VEILILHPGALGDTILALPAIQLLHRTFPSDHFTLAGNLDHLDTIVSGYVECVQSFSSFPLNRLHASEKPSDEDVRFWKSHDCIVTWTGAANADFCRNLKAIHPNVCIAAWKPAPEDPRHVAQIFVDSLSSFIGLNRKYESARITPDAAVCDEGRLWLRAHGWNCRDPLTVIHPGAGGNWKRWPLSRFIDLARHLAVQEKRKLVIIEGPAEQGIAQQFPNEIPDSEVILSVGVDLKLLAGILAHCRIFIGNDSGLSHLAAAMGLQCVVLFGPTLPQRWAPLGPNVTVLRNPYGCSACESGGSIHTCLENISVEIVLHHSRQ